MLKLAMSWSAPEGDQNWQVLTYAEVERALPTFSGPTATERLGDFHISFKQIYGGNDIPQMS